MKLDPRSGRILSVAVATLALGAWLRWAGTVAVTGFRAGRQLGFMEARSKG